MKFKEFGDKYLVRFEKGDNYLEGFTRFANENALETGTFEGIGSFDSCELGYYNPKQKKYSRKTFKTNHEVTSLTGSMTFYEGKPYFHTHVSLSNQEFKCFGGHLFEAVVGATLEVVFEKIPAAVRRKFSDEIGLNLLDL
jgi:predicted DNA-binding protein with PD1-like motif